jgi:hypothetical protein
MSPDSRRIQRSHALLIGFGAALLVPWLIVGIFFLNRLTGWPLGAASLMGGAGAFLLTSGVVRVMRANRVTSARRSV